jgi:hypothetical protein
MGLRSVIVPLLLAVVGGMILSAWYWYTFPCRWALEANAKTRQARLASMAPESSPIQAPDPPPVQPPPQSATNPASVPTAVVDNPYGIIACDDFSGPVNMRNGVAAMLLFALGIATAIFERRRPVLASIPVAAAAMTGSGFLVDYLVTDLIPDESLSPADRVKVRFLIALFILGSTVPAAVGAWMVALIRRRSSLSAQMRSLGNR